MIGIIVGLGSTFIFLVFAIVNIIIDESARHKELTMKVSTAKDSLRDSYNVEENEMAEIDAEFFEQEVKGDQFDADAEQKELAEIN